MSQTRTTTYQGRKTRVAETKATVFSWAKIQKEIKKKINAYKNAQSRRQGEKIIRKNQPGCRNVEEFFKNLEN